MEADSARQGHKSLGPRRAREARVVSFMIASYCRAHRHEPSASGLCSDCERLTSYALQRLAGCRYGDRKPSCKRCPVHCYAPDYRGRIRAVMAFAGPRMPFLMPLAYLRHLFRR
jgi:hypothetical protein